MAVSTITTRTSFAAVVANTPIGVNDIKVYNPNHMKVRYGLAKVLAVIDEDYSIAISDTWLATITPKTTLINKINARIALYPGEQNIIWVERVVPYETDFVETDAFLRRKIENEFDLVAMRIQQLATTISDASLPIADIQALAEQTSLNAALAQISATNAVAAASALGNQVANYDSYVIAQGATVLAAVKGLRVFGWSVYGDGPPAEYFRVTSQPAAPAGKLRTTDRFKPDGTIDAVNGGWWQLVISGTQDSRKFGIFAGGGDVTTRVQDAHNTCSIFFPPGIIGGNYTLFGDILLISGRRIEVQKGANVTNTGGRFTGHLPGGGDFDFEIKGTIGFIATTTAPQIPDWPAERGLIEFGGSPGSPAANIRVYGGGRVFGDYPWVGLPTTLYNLLAQINRKGIALWNCSHSVVEGMEVDHIHGEAIYFNGYGNNEDIRFEDNYVHHCAFNGLNFNVSLAYKGLVMRGNTITNVLQGIEISAGVADNNYIDTVGAGIITGAGGGSTLRLTNNKVVNSTGIGISVEYASNIKYIVIHGNEVISCGTTAYLLNFINGFQLTNNSSSGHATTGPGRSFLIQVNCVAGWVDGNTTFQPGAFTQGGFTNLAGVSVVAGTNPAF